MLLDTADMAYQEIYKIMIATVAPRPIAWAGTRSKRGVNNLAPFSFYNAFSSNPPIVGFSTIPKLDGADKDTLSNIKEQSCFTLSCVSQRLVKHMSKSAALLEADQDEFEYAGLVAAQAHSIDAPYVEGAGVVFECQLQQIVSFGEQPGSGNLILGKITHIHVADELMQENGRIDFTSLDPVGRLAGNWYSTIKDRFELERG